MHEENLRQKQSEKAKIKAYKKIKWQLYVGENFSEGEVWDQEADGRSGQWAGRGRRIWVRC